MRPSAVIPLHQHPYAPFLTRVAKPTRYTGSEHGVRNKPWDGVEARVCLAFPDLYDIGMSHLGYRILYQILNEDPRTLAERCYTPWVDLIAELRHHQVPLVSLESARPLADFDVVGFSLQYELTYTNVLAMLDLGGIPLRTADRGEDAPLVVAGGPVATHAEPLAPFIDAFLIGDGEEATTELVLRWTQARRDGLPRAARLAALAGLTGVYVPSLYETTTDRATGLMVVAAPTAGAAPFPVRRRLVPDLHRFPFPTGGPVGGPEAVFDRMSVEIARGCTEGCRFCQAGMIYRPVRERDPQSVIDTVIASIAETGQDEVSLTALSTADVSAIGPLVKSLAEFTAPRRVSLGVASLRAYGLTEDVMEAMGCVRASGLTFAPEAGTQRLRDVINKNVTEAQLMETAARVFARGFDRMKLYFMIGLPTETDEDVAAIAELGRGTLAAGRHAGGRPTITVSVSSHVPKPHTPFQWCAMDPQLEIERKQRLLRGELGRLRGIGLKTHDAATSVLEGVFARGDRRLADVLEHAYRNGAGFDSWEDRLCLDRWEAAFSACNVSPNRYLGALPVGARLPWDHIDVGVDPGFLAREYRHALQGRSSPPCRKIAGWPVHQPNVTAATKRLVCHDCGIGCDLAQIQEERTRFLVRLGVHPAPTNTDREPASIPVALPGPYPATAEEGGTDRAGPSGVAAVAQRRPHPERHRPPQPGGPAVRWRFRYEKLGALSLSGHLDLIRELGRVFRRAGATVAYTAGFHPKPAMSFSPALPLGVPSLGEYLDVRLIDAPEAPGLVGELNRVATPGLRFTAALALEPGDPTLATVLDGVEYVLSLPAASVQALGGARGVSKRIADLLNGEHRHVERVHKGRTRQFDLAAEVQALAVAGAEAEAAMAAAGAAPGALVLVVALRLGPAGGLRPAEILAAIAGGTPPSHALVRLGLRAGVGTPLDLDRLRSEIRLRAATTREGGHLEQQSV
ncbi:MAG: TIGR03960 family B12-binding radical SAM protein [Polyangiaceae bacterium]|nr:TIGR03960 family B12-binding radical SAM protein [Polyangiaceae bacterium]